MNDISNPPLAKLFSDNKDKPFLFVRPGGNWGDHLIYWGAETLANSIGISWKNINAEEFEPSAVKNENAVYIHGGGGLNAWCSGRAGTALTKALSSSAKLIIQGPTTYDNTQQYTENFLQKLSFDHIEKSVFLYGREKFTLSLLERYAPKIFNICLDNDTAFHVNRADFFKRAGIKHNQYDLCVIREDNEAPKQNFGDCNGIVIDPGIFANSFEHWLRLHAAAKSIKTNRTHTAIAGAILGIPTTILGGSYHKNQSLWEFSLQSRGVKWGEYNLGENNVIKNPIHNLKNRFNSSWKVRHFKIWLYRVPQS